MRFPLLMNTSCGYYYNRVSMPGRCSALYQVTLNTNPCNAHIKELKWLCNSLTVIDFSGRDMF